MGEGRVGAKSLSPTKLPVKGLTPRKLGVSYIKAWGGEAP
jgi:hypothetical protein